MSRRLADPYALTLLNPWAALIAQGPKRVENRSWMPYQGVNQLLIHAGKGWDRHAGRVIREYAEIADSAVTSAIVAVADLSHACQASRWSVALRCRCGDWAVPGQCHWNLANVVALPEPVPATGRQGLWRPDPATLDAVQAQLLVVRS